MGKRLLGTGLSIALLAASCGNGSEDSAPVFQVTSPTLATTSTTAPETLEYVGVPELSAEENAMCSFVQRVGQDLASSDEKSRAATKSAESASQSRTLSEPLRVRLLRDSELANAQRFANVLTRFDEAIELITMIEPGELTDQATLDQDAADAALLAEIGEGLQMTIDSLRPLDSSEQAAFEQTSGTDWLDLMSEDEYDDVLEKLNNPRTGMAREGEAREAMERLDDWSWRHCSAGLTK